MLPDARRFVLRPAKGDEASRPSLPSAVKAATDPSSVLPSLPRRIQIHSEKNKNVR